MPQTVKTKNTDRERAFFRQSKKDCLGKKLYIFSLRTFKLFTPFYKSGLVVQICLMFFKLRKHIFQPQTVKSSNANGVIIEFNSDASAFEDRNPRIKIYLLFIRL